MEMFIMHLFRHHKTIRERATMPTEGVLRDKIHFYLHISFYGQEQHFKNMLYVKYFIFQAKKLNYNELLVIS